jgi:hypothetical protein
MSDPVSSRPPPQIDQSHVDPNAGNPQAGGPKADEGGKAAQHAADQAQQKSQQDAQKAQSEALADAAQKAAQSFLPDRPSMGLPRDFMGVMESIMKEGYETAKPPSSGKTGDQDAEGSMGQKSLAQDMQKDLTTLREFMREAKYMIENQGMNVAQMFNMVKVEQGGAFWQKLQQVLQKGVLSDTLLSKKGDPAEQGQMDAAFKSLATGSAAADAMKTPGKAILDLMKAEVNPQTSMDNFLAALATLNKDGMRESADKLRSYLRRRGGVPEEAIQYYFTQKKEIFQGPFPKEPIQPVNWWYILLAIGAFATSIGVGLNIWEATLMGIGVAALMFFLSFIYRR